jgi:AcrR family transcriptional regulator
MREEGHAGASSRKVARRAGLGSKLVHYYFPTMDDLFLAVLRAENDRQAVSEIAALASDQPLRELWRLIFDPPSAHLMTDFFALAKNREDLRLEMARAARRSHELRMAIVCKASKEASPDILLRTPALAATIIGALSHLMSSDRALGITAGHSDVRGFIEQFCGG